MVDDQQGSPSAEMADPGRIVELTADIVSAYVSHNSISKDQVPELIANVGAALKEKLYAPEEAEPEPQKPAVPIRRSVTSEAVICLECGKKAKSLKRHIRTAHGMTPEEYRAKWGLPRHHPLVAPSYAERRSELARTMGLGRKRQEAAAAEAKPPRRRKAKAGQGASAG
jgi:predicted transcriptional regulator